MTEKLKYPFPSAWCSPEYQDFFTEWLRWMDVDPEDKKQILLLWCDCAGVTLTSELVHAILGEDAGRV